MKYDNWLVNPIAGDDEQICPECDEYVKMYAPECPYCGYVPPERG